jgi:hypothetical protein
MTDSRTKSRHNLIELLGGSNAESLDLDLFYHLETLFWPSPMQKGITQSCNCSAGLDDKSSQPN